MMITEPYFLTNEDWYYFDEKECRYFLTDEAPEKARKSYVDYYQAVEGDTDEDE